jgi:hypothetical protein
LCLNGHWIRRGDVIKHVAHIASGVHSGTPATPEDETIFLIRRSAWYSKYEGGGFSITFDMHAINGIAEPVFRYSPDAIDPALFQLLTSLTYLLKSPDVARLEHVIREELR